jgi:hypothetical protein
MTGMAAMARRRIGAAAPAAALCLLLAAPATHGAAEEAAVGGGDACAAVARAVRAIGEAERFHSRLLAQTPGRRRPKEEERFVLGDVVYATSPAAGRWVKLPMTAGDRNALSAGIEAHPPRDCRDEGAATMEGVATRIYAYSQDLPERDGSAGSAATGRLWVAESDGRPRRYEGRHGEVQVALTFDYDRVAPPFGK